PSSAANDPANDPVVVPRRILEQMARSSDRQLQLINSLLETHNPSSSPNFDPNSGSNLSSNLSESAKAKSPDSEWLSLNIELHRQAVAIAPLIDSIIQDIQPLLQDHPATLTCHITDDLPMANADPTQLWRVLENLITNAIKHNPPQVAVVLTVSVETSASVGTSAMDTSASSQVPPLLRFTVEDNGVGIAPTEQATLFVPYQRGTDVGQTPGLGLGLYLCQQIVAAHGGEIGVTSQIGSGATFWVTIPC
ncbi:MAG: HAMP domain-containing histidine kinase, partial [Cyanothece sp. SIO2G6]|nr:HAMP domain-containing histidine kinase [Cyanothece sp. SIO2G6]